MRDATLVCLSDFNTSNLTAYLADARDLPVVHTVPTDYGQVVPLLLDRAAECWDPKPDSALVWTRPEAVSPTFRGILRAEDVPVERALAEVDAFIDAVEGAAGRAGCFLIPTWTIPSHERGLGPLDLHPEQGGRGVLLRMNARLIERLGGARGFHVFDAGRWLMESRRPGFNAKLWYMAKIAFDNEVLKVAAAEIKAALRAVRGESRKLVVLDLDDTLWGGVVGDVGWENLVLGGHDSRGEALVDFQHRLKALSNRGILLALASKNEEAVALDAIDRHPEMVLRRSDFAGWRINWLDKAQNIAELVAELNLGLHSAVFIDDNPVERDRVRQALPDVLVPEWPDDPAAYPGALAALTCFDVSVVSAEDRQRAASYRIEREREASRAEISSVEEWLASLGIAVTIEALASSDAARAAQLLNKTNQMNLSTRRMTEGELVEWVRGEGRRFWTVRVEDRFSALGLTGLLSAQIQGDHLRVVDFVLSCRVFGRRVEDTMLSAVVRHARERSLTRVIAEYLPTAKNKPCLDFLLRSGMTRGDGGVFTWDVRDDYPFPEHVRVNVVQTASVPL
jgi:FkbH-like protein